MHKICEICKKVPATVHLTDIKNNVKKELHMCEACAESQGVTMKKDVSLGDVFGALQVEKKERREKHESDPVCPRCGMTWAEFRSQGRFGCAHDYAAFREKLSPLLEEIHTSCGNHIGKHPCQSESLSELRREQIECQRKLRDAVENERYEEAAALRDQLAKLDQQAELESD